MADQGVQTMALRRAHGTRGGVCARLSEDSRVAHAHGDDLGIRRRGADEALGAGRQHEAQRRAAREHRGDERFKCADEWAGRQRDRRRARDRFPWYDVVAAEDRRRRADGGGDAVLVEPVAAPRARVPDAPGPLHLRRVERGLRGHRALVKHRMVEHHLREHFVGRRRRVERREEIGRARRQVLQQIDPVAHAHRRIVRRLRAAGAYAVPGRPRSARARHERRVSVHVDGVCHVSDGAERVGLGRRGAWSEEATAHVGVRREHHAREAALLLSALDAQGDAGAPGRVARDRDDS